MDKGLNLLRHRVGFLVEDKGVDSLVEDMAVKLTQQEELTVLWVQMVVDRVILLVVDRQHLLVVDREPLLELDREHLLVEDRELLLALCLSQTADLVNVEDILAEDVERLHAEDDLGLEGEGLLSL